MKNCDYCGQYPIQVINLNGTCACRRCAGLFNTCHLCLNSTKCEFETNPSPIPKTITKIVQKGNMKVQVEIDNPDRIEAFCLTCPCWCDCCGRFGGTCGNYNEYIPSLNSDE